MNDAQRILNPDVISNWKARELKATEPYSLTFASSPNRMFNVWESADYFRFVDECAFFDFGKTPYTPKSKRFSSEFDFNTIRPRGRPLTPLRQRRERAFNFTGFAPLLIGGTALHLEPAPAWTAVNYMDAWMEAWFVEQFISPYLLLIKADVTVEPAWVKLLRLRLKHHRFPNLYCSFLAYGLLYDVYNVHHKLLDFGANSATEMFRIDRIAVRERVRAALPFFLHQPVIEIKTGNTELKIEDGEDVEFLKGIRYAFSALTDREHARKKKRITKASKRRNKK